MEQSRRMELMCQAKDLLTGALSRDDTDTWGLETCKRLGRIVDLTGRMHRN